ncbi:MAG: hypothetical protein KAJ51_06045, partial [Thermoplasmata archaeon]|nr:hypothetical protein [Thermoplasmata archaeon]
MTDTTGPTYGTRAWAVAQHIRARLKHSSWPASANFSPATVLANENGWLDDPKYDTGWSLWQEAETGLISDMPGFDEAKKAHTERIFGEPHTAHEDPSRTTVEADISKCPACGGPADNGYDREVPPNPYHCTKCNEADLPDRPDPIEPDQRDHLIARQQLLIEDLKEQLGAVAVQHKQVYNLLFNIGAPLNDNRLEFNLEQR